MKPLKQKFRQVKKWPLWVFFFPATLLRLLYIGLRRRVEDPAACLDADQFPFVGVVWHNRLLLLPIIFPKFARRRTAAVVSASRDGQYLADLLKYFGVGSLRGSSSRGGEAVLREGMKLLRQGTNVCITPDGPRGPRYRMNKGAVALASATGTPILPFAINTSSYWELKTWDRFRVPKPWSTATLKIGHPIQVPPELDEQGIEEYRLMVEKALLELNEI